MHVEPTVVDIALTNEAFSVGGIRYFRQDRAHARPLFGVCECIIGHG